MLFHRLAAAGEAHDRRPSSVLRVPRCPLGRWAGACRSVPERYYRRRPIDFGRFDRFETVDVSAHPPRVSRRDEGAIEPGGNDHGRTNPRW